MRRRRLPRVRAVVASTRRIISGPRWLAGIYNFPEAISAELAMILSDEPVPLESRRGDLPAWLCRAIHRALSRRWKIVSSAARSWRRGSDDRTDRASWSGTPGGISTGVVCRCRIRLLETIRALKRLTAPPGAAARKGGLPPSRPFGLASRLRSLRSQNLPLRGPLSLRLTGSAELRPDGSPG